MSTYNGRNARIMIGANLVAEQGNWTLNMTADEIDTTSFGSEWGKSDVGMLKWNGSISGNVDPSDAGVQALETAFLAGSLISDLKLYLKYSTTSGQQVTYWSPDTATDPDAGARITAFNLNVDKNGVGQLTVNFSGSGPIVRTTETLP